MNLLVKRGPLSDKELLAIGATYGTIDERYASVEFCRILFNENPIGYSFHVFVLNDTAQIVGHYAVIPIRITINKRLALSGKGEALYLADEYRNSVVEYCNSTIPTGIALMNAAHDFAMASGITVLHNITRSDVGIIQRIAGFRHLQISRDAYYYIIDASRVNSFQVSAKLKLAGKLLQVGNQTLYRLARLRLGRKTTQSIQVLPGIQPDADRQVGLSEESDPRWRVSSDKETVRWYEQLGTFNSYLSPDGCRMITRSLRGHAFVAVWPYGDSIRFQRALLLSAIQNAIDTKQISFSIPTATVKKHESLEICTKRLGFVMRSVVTNLYVKSDDPFFSEASNIHYDTFFNL
ncbi:MAG: hypothetical protein OEM52_06455 [bacterium]|nr:hypothetical protein [bacterium]